MLEVITDVLQSSSPSSATPVTSTSTTSMDISESFRPEDLSKTDFFDFVTSPDYTGGINIDRPPSDSEQNGTSNNQPLQGFDQVSTKYLNFNIYLLFVFDTVRHATTKTNKCSICLCK
jgi:hypothetical protein